MLEDKNATVSEERNSRKEPLDDAAVQQLLGESETVFVARGKKVREIAADQAALDDLKGPTGNYRAPIVRAGGQLLVGFHPETLGGMLD